jgi:hypothetical protein
LATGIILIAPPLIHIVSRDKQMLSLPWLCLLALNGLLDTHLTAWNTLISLWNRLPMLWPSLATNATALALNLILAQLPHSQAGFLVLGPLIAGALFNYWFWPRYGARTLGLSWQDFLGYSFRHKH